MNFCRNKSEVTVQLFDRTKDILPVWNEILPTNHFLQTAHLNIYEQAELPDISYLYALVWVNKEAVAAAYFQVINIRKYHLNTFELNSYQKLGWQLFANFSRTKLLVSGHLFRHDICSFYWRGNCSMFDVFNMYKLAIVAAQKKACTQAVLVKDVNNDLTPYFQHYAPDFLQLRNDISMEFQLPFTWKNMNDYEQSLKHKYAQRYRKIRNAWCGLTITELTVDETENNKKTLYDLYMQVSDKQSVRLGNLTQKYLPLLKKKHPDELRIWMVKEQEKPVAFLSAWVHPYAFDMFYIGFDYEQNERLQLYFNILFFSMEQTITIGKKKLILGRTALEAKARLGCSPRYLSTYLSIRNPLVRKVIFQLQQNISSKEGEWENRHPFKISTSLMKQ